MQQVRWYTYIDHVFGCSWTGMVGHHAPALWHFLINIGGNHKGLFGPLGRDDFDSFDQVMHSARE